MFKSKIGLVFLAGCALAVLPNQHSFHGTTSPDRYVSPSGSDINNGTAARPWRTITHAVSAVLPGMTVHVAKGKYFGSLVTAVSGRANARIRFISDEQWAAQIIGDATSEAVWLNRGDYVDVMGFDISGANPNGIETVGSFTRIIGNRIGPILASCDDNGGAGINSANYHAHDNDTIANLVHDVGPLPGCSRRHGVGIYHSNAGGRIYDNIVFHNGFIGIQLWHAATGVIVANNTVFSNVVVGIVVGAGDSPGNIVNDGTIVANNISLSNGIYGIQEFGFTGPRNLYIKNLVFQNGKRGIQLLTGKAQGTIEADPQLVQFGNSGGNYYPAATSPAVHAADPHNAPNRDFQGGNRPAGRAPDIGAYERGAGAGKWPDSWVPH